MPPSEAYSPNEGCSLVVVPMAAMRVDELGSSAALEMLVFQRLVDGNGTKLFRPPPFGPYVGVPTVIPLQAVIDPYCGFDCAGVMAAKKSRTKQVTRQSALSGRRAPTIENGDCTNVMVFLSAAL
jgi:hypothetical protein